MYVYGYSPVHDAYAIARLSHPVWELVEVEGMVLYRELKAHEEMALWNDDTRAYRLHELTDRLERVIAHETESPWCCMACCEAGHALHGHFRCATTVACGTGAHAATTHGVLD